MPLGEGTAFSGRMVRSRTGTKKRRKRRAFADLVPFDFGEPSNATEDHDEIA